jgi:hypothetical protein
MKRLVQWLLALSSVVALLLLPAAVLAGNLLTNGGFETFSDIPGRTWDGINEKVGTGWNYFYIPSATRLSKLHWFSSTDFTARFNPGEDPYELEGGNGSAQNMWSAYEFDAGIYQRVTGLTTGTVYAFDVPLVTYWRGPGYPPSDGIMKKWVGIDPYGGTDPTSPNVIWSDVNSQDKAWIYMDIAARAESDAMTFFVRIQAPENDSVNHVDLDMVYIDAAKADLAPTVNLDATASGADVTFSWTGSAAPGWDLKGVEVQYRDELDGMWQTIQGKTGDGNSSYPLSGQAGHTYTVRARPWQTMVETYNSDIDMPGLWVEKSVTLGGAFSGYVRNHFDMGIGGATVSIAGTGSSTSSDPGGFYGLVPPAYGSPYPVSASASGYKSPLPITATVANATSITPITFTLKPANDAIQNGDFESDSSDWTLSGVGSATVFSGGHRSGKASLELTGPIILTQAADLSGVYNPTLSFWYNPSLTGGDSFEVTLSQGSTLLASKVFTESTTVGWQHAWLALDQTSQYTGTLTVSFHLTGGQVSLDEVSLGNGPHTLFLPVILQSATS